MKKDRAKERRTGCLLNLLIIVWGCSIFYGIRFAGWADLSVTFATHKELFLEMAEYHQRKEHVYASISMWAGKASASQRTLSDREIEIFKYIYHKCGVDVVLKGETTVVFESSNAAIHQYLVYSEQSLDSDSIVGDGFPLSFETLDENLF